MDDNFWLVGKDVRFTCVWLEAFIRNRDSKITLWQIISISESSVLYASILVESRQIYTYRILYLEVVVDACT